MKEPLVSHALFFLCDLLAQVKERVYVGPEVAPERAVSPPRSDFSAAQLANSYPHLQLSTSPQVKLLTFQNL